MFGKKSKKDAELEYLRAIASQRFVYKVQGETLIGPASFADLYLMAKYSGGTLEIREEVARGVGIEMTVYDIRYENVMRKEAEND